ncbi:MAG TPA: DUF4105 domain-containing protein [Dokdonella sp.]
MSARAARVRRAGVVAARVLTALAIVLAAAWGAFALAFQAPGGRVGRDVAVALWIAFSAAALGFARRRRRLAPAVFAAAFGLLLLWWHSIAPSNGRLWADDVARTARGSVVGDRVVIDDVRDFEWRSDTDYTARWQTRSYDLRRLRSVDLILSYWGGPAIAHMIVSFGFDDDRYVAFSVEVRREKTEAYSEIGGFFKQFEIAVIAADERDVVRVRTNVRGEDDYLYRVKLAPAAMRALFAAYVEEANRLAREPRFYDTVTANCTTLVYHMMQQIVGRIPFDHRLLLTGYLPEYVYALGALDTRYPLATLRAFGRITERARAADASPTFSTDIRAGIPPLDAR